MNHSSPDFLRKVLFTDALTCMACGLAMVAGAGPLAALTNIPGELLSSAGLALFPIAAFIGWVGARASHSRAALAAVVAGNLAWSLASVWLMLGSVIAPTALGHGFIGMQAAVVLVLTALELKGAQAVWNPSLMA
jgi:hypothetical protein